MSDAHRIAPSIPSSAFAGSRLPPEVIILAVRWYLRFGLSCRDVEVLLAERGIKVAPRTTVLAQALCASFPFWQWRQNALLPNAR